MKDLNYLESLLHVIRDSSRPVGGQDDNDLDNNWNEVFRSIDEMKAEASPAAGVEAVCVKFREFMLEKYPDALLLGDGSMGVVTFYTKESPVNAITVI